jgi:FlaA1/EpsC-like NDP-sugar epimerase
LDPALAAVCAWVAHQIVSFLDDAPSLWRRTINGIPIQPPQVLSQIHEQLDQVLLAIPSLPRSERRRVVAELQRQAIPVLQIPSVDHLTSGRARIDALRPVAIEDLLGQKGFQGATSSPWGMGRSAAARLSGRGCGGCGG